MELTYPFTRFNAWPLPDTWSVDQWAEAVNGLAVADHRRPARTRAQMTVQKDEFFVAMERRLKEIDEKIHELAQRVKDLEARKKDLGE